MMVNGIEISVRVNEPIHSPMVLTTRVSGKKIRKTVEASLIGAMVQLTMENGKIISAQEKAYLNLITEIHTPVNGIMTK